MFFKFRAPKTCLLYNQKPDILNLGIGLIGQTCTKGQYIHQLCKELAMAGLIKRGETWHARVRWYEKEFAKKSKFP